MSSNPSRWRELYPFESSWHDLPAGRMHYIDVGPREAPPLLYVHGNPTWSFHWRNLIQGLGDSYRHIAVDHMGCGLSDKPDRGFRLADHIDHVVSLVDSLGLSNITLVAQDWGGAIGLGTMLKRPEAFSRVVLFNTGAFPPWYIPQRIAACRIPVVGRWGVQGLNLFTRAALRMTLARKAGLEPAVAEGYLATTDTWGHRRQTYEFVADIPMKRSHPTWQTLHDIEQGLPSLADKPKMLVWGMRDWCFRPDCLTKFESLWPDAEAYRLADVGHWVVEDAPDEALQLVDSFLTRTTNERSS